MKLANFGDKLDQSGEKCCRSEKGKARIEAEIQRLFRLSSYQPPVCVPRAAAAYQKSGRVFGDFGC
jgi:hypothetical protein